MKTLFSAISLLFASSISTLVAISSANAATIVPPGSEVAGKTISEWTADWWQWAFSQSVPNDAFTDTTGENANVNQSGPIFFIAGTTGGEATRSFTVPSDKYLLLPLVNFIGDLDFVLPDGTTMTIDDVIALADTVDSLIAEIDGIPVENPFDFRETTPDTFVVEAAENDPIFGDRGTFEAFADGYYVMVEPLSSGTTSTFTFGGGSTALQFSTQVSSNITAVPEPMSILAVIAVGAVTAGGALEKKKAA